MAELITEDWLREAGFRWHHFDRQSGQHWLLWLGCAEGMGKYTNYEDLGIELATLEYTNSNGDRVREGEGWFVWLRNDTAGRYHRFIHIRHMRHQHELIALIEALTGQSWNPDNHLFGSVHTPAHAAHIRDRETHLDSRLRKADPWYDIEKDDSRGRALPDHVSENIKRGGK